MHHVVDHPALLVSLDKGEFSCAAFDRVDTFTLWDGSKQTVEQYRGIVNTWRNKCDNIDSADAANIAGSDLCNSYLRPADSTQAQKRATRAEAIYSAMMNSIG